MRRDPASFRDLAGHVYEQDGRILRTVMPRAAAAYEGVRDSGALASWIERGWVIPTAETAAPTADNAIQGAAYVLEHTRVPFVSYPYEWSFGLLKAAAVLQLDLLDDALARGRQLSDATAYNVQFVGARPVFIDVLSFREYHAGDYWIGHRQFCEQFLNPLLLRSLVGVPHNAWFRGSPEGIPAVELDALLPRVRKLSWNVLSHVTIPARLARKHAASPLTAVRPSRPLPLAAYRGLVTQLRHWIGRLEPRNATPSVWRGYETMGTYEASERERKHAFVAEFIGTLRPTMLWDIGCNTGEFSEAALKAGAHYVVGFDADHGALDAAFARATDRQLAFLPLFLDAANPSPDQGWNQQERRGLAARGPADALLALAVVHHLAIGRNVPLEAIARWLADLAPRGIIEFVPKNDPTVQLMLANREDVFDGYDQTGFETALGRHARIVRGETVSSSGRRLYEFERT